MHFYLRRILCIPLLLLCSACAQDHFESRKITFDQLPGWQNDDQTQALKTFATSCQILENKARPASAGSSLVIPAVVWRSLCDEAQRLNPKTMTTARQFFELRFTPFRIANNGRENGLFTGYYEPVLYGSLHPKGDFRYPVYMAPPELKNGKPYLTHEQIDNGALAGRHLELAWVDDPVMLFFMQIQGSGRIRLPNGREIYVGYADGNGQPYVSLGKIMGDEDILPKDQINFFTIRQWLYDHPDKAFGLMERNPSYVFFHKTESHAVGAVGAVLTPGRSLAVDSSYIPYGLPLYLETTLPSQSGEMPYQRLMVAQDTGGAIRGPVRADIFFGAGDEAEYLAGNMKGHGFYDLLVPKEAEAQLQKPEKTSWWP